MGSMLGEELSLSIMITTRNRVSDLRRTIEVLSTLDPQPDEILITADGCTDDTVKCIKLLLPNARLLINENGRGSVASRDHMLRTAKSDLVLSLDDDSYPLQTDCVALLRGLFFAIPQVAVAHFPQRTDEYPDTLYQIDFGNSRHTGSYANSGACYRRSTYLALPGFEESFFHMYEEPDYALQCIASGYHVLFWPGVTIRHHYSAASRNELLVHQRHARNELWSAFIRCPLLLLIFIIPYRIISQFSYSLSKGIGWVVREPIWWWSALVGLFSSFRLRRSVSVSCYIKWLILLHKSYSFVSGISCELLSNNINKLKASLVITTKDRKEDLRRALKSALCQSVNLEIVVIDDGSVDGTQHMVMSEFPTVRFVRSEKSKGLIVQRNFGAQIAMGEIIFSIDDDAEFSTPDVVEQTLRDFDNPLVGVVAIPFVEPKKGELQYQKAPFFLNSWITETFVGTAHALRRGIFNSLEGYRDHLIHQGEESDFAIRMLDKRYLVRLGRADPIIHWESPKRDLRRIDFYGVRNAILFQWQNAPLLFLLPALLVTTINCLRWTLEPRRLLIRLRGVCCGFGAIFLYPRTPVRLSTYRLWRRLRRHQAVGIDQLVL